jgi:hypothetical protein
MPYLICPRCRLTTYSAALWSSVDECPRCGEQLPPRPGATVTSIAAHPRFACQAQDAHEDGAPTDEDRRPADPPASA